MENATEMPLPFNNSKADSHCSTLSRRPNLKLGASVLSWCMSSISSHTNQQKMTLKETQVTYIYYYKLSFPMFSLYLQFCSAVFIGAPWPLWATALRAMSAARCGAANLPGAGLVCSGVGWGDSSGGSVVVCVLFFLAWFVFKHSGFLHSSAKEWWFPYFPAVFWPEVAG